MANKVFVSPFGNDWKVKTVGSERAAGVFDTKTEAVERAIKLSKNQSAELFVQNRDGKIGWKNSYSNDPRDIKG